MIDLKGHLLLNSMTVLRFCYSFKIMNWVQLGRTNDGLIFLGSHISHTSSGPHIIIQICSLNNMQKRMCIEMVGFGY